MKRQLTFNLLVLILFGSIKVYGQSISGQQSPALGATETYSYSDGFLYMSFTWHLNKGTIVNTWNTGTTYYAQVQWTQTGTDVVNVSDGGSYLPVTLSVNIIVPVPGTSFTITYGCGSTTVTRNTDPQGGYYDWWWQTAGKGTSLSLGNGNSYTFTATSTVYLRARSLNSPAEWSTTSQSTGSITVYTTGPPAPTVGNNAARFGAGPVTLSVGAVSGATDYKWYDQLSGGTPITSGVSGTTYSIASLAQTKSYYVSALIGGCESSTRKEVIATIEPSPQIVVAGGGAPVIALNKPVVLATAGTYTSYTWKNSGGTTIATTATASILQPGAYTVTVTKSGVTGSGISAAITVTKGLAGLNMNYVISNTILKDGVKEIDVDTLSVKSLSQNIQYLDGLGRPIQSVVTQGSPIRNDVVQPIAYDLFGREKIGYLPVVPNTTDGWYKANANTGSFYSGSTYRVPGDTRPYGEVIFEASPLNRPDKEFGPGQDWYNNNAFIQHSYLTNVHGTATGEEKVIAWDISSNAPVRAATVSGYVVSGGYYATAQLTVKSTKDEQGRAVREYTDKEGRIILKKVQYVDNPTLSNREHWAQTYYIYDAMNNLRFVLQPELSKLIHQNDSYNPQATDLENWAFSYAYDSRKRMITKKIPGADPVYMVYDKRDRLVLTQDGNQRPLKQWLYTKYDEFNRPIMTGIYTHATVIDQAAMSALISTTVFYETYNGAGATHGYTSTAGYFPASALSLLTATYYDNYSFKSLTSGLNYVNNDYTGQPAVESGRTQGMATGAKVNILGTATYLYAVSYYDDKARTVQTIAQNHRSGTDRTTNKFDFVGKVLETKRTYVVNSVTRSVKETFTYDHAGRLLNVKHSTNGAADVIIVKNEYNELGQVVDKKLHSRDNGNTFKQSVDYQFNIRGWLTKINESNVSTLASGETLGDYFGMELAYNTSIAAITSTPVYNGNISAVKWSTGAVGAAHLQGNAYTYDELDRLKNSSHYKDGLAGWASDNSNLETGLTYDMNGNIQALIRRGPLDSLYDQLSYSYTGNKLNYVHDAGNATKGFVNGNTGTDDYDYDKNGNLWKDRNKGIHTNGDIKYNYLNLPSEVVVGSNKVKYFYDATGRKLYQELYTGATVTKTTDYIGELIFENNTLQFINHSEGRVVPDGANWEYQYHLKDHLGNVRLTFTEKVPAAVISTATFETGTQAAEQATFNNYSSIGYDLVDYTDAGTASQKVQHLNGGVNGRVGLAKSYAVMPGDKIKAEVYAKYRSLSGSSNNTSFIAALANAFGTSSTATGELGKVYSGLNSYAGFVPGGEHTGDDDTAPKAFVTILLFDKNYQLVNAAWDQIDIAANQVSGTVKSPPVHDYMVKEITVSEPGYAYVFLSNEHPTFVDIYYDNVTMTHTPSPIIGVNDYYPFGLSFNSYRRENTVANQYLYNGKEKQDELDLGWLDYGARMYMPEIGRWGVIDPLAEKYDILTLYNYAVNNPILFVDPDGRDGMVTGSGTKEDPYVVTANYYYVKGSLNDDELTGLNDAVAAYNSAGGKNGLKIENEDGSFSYVKFNVRIQESESLDEAKQAASENSFIDTSGAERSYGNIVGIDNTGEKFGSATSTRVNINREDVEAGVKNGFNKSSLLKGVVIHEIGHNLGGEHSDGTETMQNAEKKTEVSQISSGNGARSTHSYSYPVLTNKFISVIFRRRDTRNNDVDSNINEPALYTKKK